MVRFCAPKLAQSPELFIKVERREDVRPMKFKKGRKMKEEMQESIKYRRCENIGNLGVVMAWTL